MKVNIHKLPVLFLLSFVISRPTFAQLSVPDYTACPCQTITAFATWNNASSVTYSLYTPGPGGGSTMSTFASPSFTIFNCSPVLTTVTYTLVGAGVYQGNPTVLSDVFNLTISPPASMTLTNTITYCSGSTATIVAPPGGNVYSYFGGGGGNTGNSSSNIITIGPLSNPHHVGSYSVTTVVAGCTLTGVTNIDVAPLKVMTASLPVSICQDPTNCVNINGNLPGGDLFSYQWFHNNSLVAATQGMAVCGSLNESGIYTVTANDIFNGILCPYSATTQVTVVQANPVVVSASPSRTLCQGANLNLSASAGSPPPSSWLWSGPFFSSNANNPVIASSTPVNSGEYTVTANFQGGGITCPKTAVITVSIIPTAVPSISMTQNICLGDTLVVMGAAGANPVALNWSGPLFTGTVTTSGPVISVNSVPANASGTQYLTATFGAGQVQCHVTSSLQLNVVLVNEVMVVPPAPLCTPSDAFLQSQAIGANNYLWQGPGGFSVPGGGNMWITNATPSVSGIYTVTAYFGSGTSLVCTSTNTLELIVNPILNFSLVPRQQICYNTPFTLNGPSGATSYTWTSSTGFTSNDKDITIPSAQPFNTGTYTLAVSLGSCVTAAESELDVLTPLSFSLTPLDRIICRGDTVFLEGGATGGSENYAYDWFPSTYLQSSTGAEQWAIPLGSIKYNLSVHDLACPNYSIVHSFDVDVNVPPIPKLELEQYYACVPLTQVYDIKTWNESAITTYDFGGKYIFQRDSVFTYALDEPGTYSLTIYTKGKNGCSGVYKHMYPIVVNPKPGADIYWNPETPTTNDVITFNAIYNGSGSESITYMNWNFLGGVTPGDTTMNNLPNVSDTTNINTPTRMYSQFGTYPVVLISQNDKGCIDTVYKEVKVIDELQIFVPNTFTPNGDGINDLFMAKGSGIKLENFRMEIFNRAGLMVFSSNNINEGWDGKVGGQLVKDATYIYKIRVIGMNGEGRKDLTGYVTLLK